MTTCNQCGTLCNGLGPYCEECEDFQREYMMGADRIKPMDHDGCHKLRQQLEDDLSSYRELSKRLQDENTALRAQREQAVKAGENAARRADEVICKLEGIISDYRSMLNTLVDHFAKYDAEFIRKTFEDPKYDKAVGRVLA